MIKAEKERMRDGRYKGERAREGLLEAKTKKDEGGRERCECENTE